MSAYLALVRRTWRALRAFHSCMAPMTLNDDLAAGYGNGSDGAARGAWMNGKMGGGGEKDECIYTCASVSVDEHIEMDTH